MQAQTLLWYSSLCTEELSTASEATQFSVVNYISTLAFALSQHSWIYLSCLHPQKCAHRSCYSTSRTAALRNFPFNSVAQTKEQ